MYFQLEKLLMYGSSALAEKNQQQFNKFNNPYQARNSQENATGYMSSPPVEIRTSLGPIFKKIDAYSIKSDAYRPLGGG